MDQLHLFVSGGPGRFFEVQLATYGNAEHGNAGPLSPGDQGFEYLLRRQADGFRRMQAAQIRFVKWIKGFPVWDAPLLHQANGIGFAHHFTFRFYYTSNYRF